jgi:hypothetical protein
MSTKTVQRILIGCICAIVLFIIVMFGLMAVDVGDNKFHKGEIVRYIHDPDPSHKMIVCRDSTTFWVSTYVWTDTKGYTFHNFDHDDLVRVNTEK